MITCILLSAGESRRFGSPKALADIKGKKAIELILETLLASSIDEVIVVLGAHMESIRPHVLNHKKVQIVYNKYYKLGQTSSFQTGIVSVDEQNTGIMLWPVDHPFIFAETVNELVLAFKQIAPSILIPQHKSQRGHPPIFNSTLKQEICKLPTDQGINTLFNHHSPTIYEVNDPGILRTFNTTKELKG